MVCSQGWECASACAGQLRGERHANGARVCVQMAVGTRRAALCMVASRQRAGTARITQAHGIRFGQRRGGDRCCMGEQCGVGGGRGPCCL